MMMAGVAGDYLAHGLHLCSELELPELTHLPADSLAPTVQIRVGPVGTISSISYADAVCQIGDDDLALSVDDVAQYRVRHGEEILVEPCRHGSDANIRSFLLGAALGILCHQRGLLALHASAIEVNGRAIAFAGISGAGKSTLAALFYSRGYAIICDDLCVVSLDDLVQPAVFPGVPRLRLWRDAAETLGWQTNAGVVEFDGREKYQFRIGSSPTNAALPLQRIYVLEQACQSAPRHIRPLRGTNAIDALLSYTHRRRLLSPMGCAALHFILSTCIAKRVPIFALRRRLGFRHLAADAEALEQHFLGNVAGQTDEARTETIPYNMGRAL